MKTTTLIGLCTIVAMAAMCGQASAWLPGYDYRMQIDINNTADNLTDYQYNFTVDTETLASAGKMNVNGSDFRITNVTDSLLPFWNETAFNDSGTKIWVNASLGNITNTTHYFYYGNSGESSAASGENTFQFFDDFGVRSNGGWTWWQTPRAVHYTGTHDKTYWGGVSSSNVIWISSYDHTSKEYNSFDLHTLSTPDDHDAPSILILNNSKIVVFYSAHNSNVMRWRISTNPEDITSFGTEKTFTYAPGYVAYPQPVQISEENNKTYLFYRERPSDNVWSYRTSTDNCETFSATSTVMLDFTNDWQYTRPIQEGDKLHFAAMDRASTTSMFDILYFYYHDGSFYKADDTLICNVSGLPMDENDLDMVYDTSDAGNHDCKLYDIAVDSNGYPRIVFATLETDSVTYDVHKYRYARWNGAAWSDHHITDAGTYITSSSPSYSGGIELDKNDPNIVYLSKQVSGQWEMEKFVTSDGGENWTITNITTGSSVKNIRPCAPLDSSAELPVFWLWGTYTTYVDWETSVTSSPIEDDWTLRQGMFDFRYGSMVVKTAGTRGLSDYATSYSYPLIYETQSRFSKSTVNGAHFTTMRESNSWNNKIDLFGHSAADQIRAQTRKAGSTTDTSGIPISAITDWNIYKIIWESSQVRYYENDALKATHTTNIPLIDLAPSVYEGDLSGSAYLDWARIRKYSSTEPTSSLGAEESAPSVDYIPPTPTTIANTTGNFWVNHTWSAGSGNITDSYNVSVNDVWHNTSPAYYNDTYSAHAWSNVTVYAFNSSGNGTLSSDNVSQNTQIPNNQITITNTSDWSGDAGNNVYVDYDATDADSDTPTFSCNRTDMFTDFNTATGTGNWTYDAGTYYVDFGVSDGYGSTDNYTMTIEAAPVSDYTPPNPTNIANTTGNFWVNHTWSAGSGNITDSYNVSVNDVWHNTSPAYYNDTYSAHAWQNITVYAYNSSSTGTLSAGNISQNTQIPNNPITITNTSGWNGNEGENVYVDYDATDVDSDTPTFSCNRTDLFTDFDTATGQGNWTATAGTYHVDFGVSDGYGSTSNYTMTITTSTLSISLHSVSPEEIQTNYTGEIKVNYLVESTNPLNLSSLALLYGINYTITGDMHSYIAAPANSIASDGIYRAPNRNTTPYLSWENNATITEGNVWQWGGGDNDSWWITKTPINATHTWVNVTGIPEHAFQSSFYLKKTAMYSAPKTAFEVNRQQGLIIKMWDNEAIRARSIDYIMNMYFDSDWESTIPSHPIEIWGLNSSFNPDTDDPTTSEFGAKIVEWDGNRWVNHSWVPGPNASYAYPLILNASSFPVIPDEINYIYLKSGTLASKSYVLNATDYDPGICNITYAQTETMWTYDELSDVSDQVAFTPSFFTTFVRDDEQFLHHLYIADDQGVWTHSGINNISIGVSHYPVDASSFEYFNISCPTLGYTLDTGMGSTYDNGYMHIGIYCHADPDGGTVSHNITLHYVNGTLAGIINDTFQTTSPGLYEINFSTTPYYSTTDAYILKCNSTDDEGDTATTWVDSFFTLAADGTQGYYTNGYLMFWGMNDIPTLYSVIANNSLISYDAGDDIYTMHVPFFKSKYNDTFRFNETVHLKSLNTEDVAYFRFSGETIFDNANIHGWNTTTDTLAPSTDTYRAYMFSRCRTTGNITNSNLSYLGSDVYQQEGINFIDNVADYLIYNTTLTHNNRGIIMEECENFNISHCNIHDNTEVGIGIYYSNNTVVENSTVDVSGYNPCIYLYEANDNIIRYNTIQNCVDYGIQVRSNSNNNIFTGNNVTGSGIYDYYFRAASVNNSIIDPASATDKIRATITSEVNIENTDNAAFTEDSPNSTYAYPTNFSMRVAGVSQTFNITQRDITVTPDADSVQIWNLVFGNVVTFNATNSTGSPHVWFNITQSTWGNANISIYRDDVIYANETADQLGHIAYNYSGGWSEHWFEFASPNAAPDKPTVVSPANGATGTSTNPTLAVQVTDDNSDDLLNVTFYAQGGTQIGSTQTGIANDTMASVVWSGRSYSTTYYWYAVADDGTAQTQSDTWHFRTQGSGSGSSHVIDITGCTDWEGNAGSQVYIDFGCTGETAGAVFTTNATNGSIDSSTGVYTWNTAAVDAGVYTWRFDVENVYSVSDYCDVTVTVYHYASPTNLAATTGNFWVNHTWDGNGFADSYNISVNGVWTNGSTAQHSYHARYPHAWSNISVAAYNDTTGLSSFISNDVQVPNNAIVLTNYTTLMLATAGDNVTVDMNHEDLDGDTATYYCSRMDLFTDFNTADGTGQYTNAINGTHEVIFGVTDGYGWSNQTITIEVGTVHPLELDEETPLLLFVVLVVLLFGSLFYIYHAASYVAKIVTALISTWMSFMLSNMAVSGNVVLNYAELSSGDAFIYGTHSIQIAALSHLFMFTGVVSALFMLAFAVKLVIDTYLDMQEKRKADEEWDGVEEQ